MTKDSLVSSSQKKFTICICTWNRAKLLVETLESLSRISIPSELKGAVDILVVDNKSTDATREVVTGFDCDIPIRYLYVGVAGKSHALNHAIGQIQSSWILFTDDDVRVPNNWFERYYVAIEAASPTTVFLGSGVVPLFEVTPKAVMSDALDSVRQGFCGVTVPRDLEISDPSAKALPVGANCAFRGDILKSRSFDTSLGPSGKSHVTSEEWKMMRELLTEGYKGRWVEGNTVLHYVPADRLTLKYLKRFYFGLGCAEVLNKPDKVSPRINHVPRWIYKQILFGLASCACSIMLLDMKSFYKAYANLSSLLGRVEGYKRLRATGHD